MLRKRFAAASIAAALLVAQTALAGDESTPTRETMRRVFEALAVLLPASATSDWYTDPAKRDSLQPAFEELARASGSLAEHGAPGDEAFRLFARSLAADAEDAASRFARGRVGEALFLVGRLTQRCAGCHSRLPAAREFPFAERLIGALPMDRLPVEDRATLLVATRRFDDALATWEGLFADPAVPPLGIEQGGAVADYLTIAVRVEMDLPRAERTLTALAKRPDTPRALRRRLIGWTDALRELVAVHRGTSRLDRAAILATRSRSFVEFPFDDDALVLDLYASSLVEQDVAARTERGSASGPELARAFWLLAVLETRTTPAMQLSEEETYMEAALRADPTGTLAERAYEKIEEIVLSDYGAMTEADLPEQARARLTELREIMGEKGPGV
jgi:mono/diheme cytochrome c family protein